MTSAAKPLQSPPIPVALIGDHRVAGEGIAALLNQFDDLKVVYGHASDAITPLKRVSPQVVLLDIGLRRDDSLGVAARVKREFPDVKLIAIDQLPVHEDVVEFVNAGVSGFTMKDDPMDHLVNTIRLVESGAKVLPPAMVNTLFSQIAREPMVRPPATGPTPAPGQMTAREREVINLIAAGLSNKEIAERMNISAHTVKSHVRNVMAKLELHTRLQVAAFAFKENAP
jgi:DNA-binding NarL/FixJ family response regulator